jgi:hypothetical protein
MKQITPISKKNKHRPILILSVCLLALTSCSGFEPLPERIKSDCEFAIPIMDTTVVTGDFASFNITGEFPNIPELPDTFNLPKDTVINIKIKKGEAIKMGELEYPFYIGDYAMSQEIEWIDPHLIISTKDFPSGTTLNIRIYTKDKFKNKSYFWLPEDYTVTLTDYEPVRVPESPSKIQDTERFRNARKVFVDVWITYPEEMSLEQIIDDRVNIKFAIRFVIKTDLQVKI